MKLPRIRRLTLLMALTVLPILLAWYIAAKRSWLPTVRRVYQGRVVTLKFSSTGQEIAAVGWRKTKTTESLEANSLAGGTLQPVKPLARYTAELTMLLPVPPPPYSVPPMDKVKDPCEFLSSDAIYTPDFQRIGDLVMNPAASEPGENAMIFHNHIEIRDAITHKLKCRSIGSVVHRNLRFSPQGTFMVTIEEGRCVLRNTHDFRKVKLADPQWGDSQSDSTGLAEFSPDERWLVGAATRGQFRVWDTHTGRLVRAFSRPLPHAKDVSAAPCTLVFSQDSRLMASADATQTVWELATGKMLRTMSAPKPNQTLAFAPDTSLLASGDGNTITLWDWRANTKLRTLSLKASPQWVTALAWSPDDNFLVSGYEDGTLARWRIK